MGLEPCIGPDENCLSEQVSASESTLVLAPHSHDRDAEICLDLLTVTDPANENVLIITFEETSSDRSRQWNAQVSTDPHEFVIVDIDLLTRSAASTGTTSEPTQPSTAPTTHTIPDPSDLTRLGVTISNQLKEWKDTRIQTVVCFHSLTILSEYISQRRLFRFVHLLLKRLRESDAVSHFHLDPDLVDDEVIHLIKPLFQRVISLNESMSIQVEEDI